MDDLYGNTDVLGALSLDNSGRHFTTTLYNKESSKFVSSSSSSSSRRINTGNDENKNTQNVVSVRHVTNKKIKSNLTLPFYKNEKQRYEYQNHASSAASEQNYYHRNNEYYDTFNGIIDSITGEMLSGTRTYTLTGETYEGTFIVGTTNNSNKTDSGSSNGDNMMYNNNNNNNGVAIRHDKNAIVKNIYIKQPPMADLYLSSSKGGQGGQNGNNAHNNNNDDEVKPTLYRIISKHLNNSSSLSSSQGRDDVISEKDKLILTSAKCAILSNNSNNNNNNNTIIYIPIDLSFHKANFFGEYRNDEPYYGNLITDNNYTYKGYFKKYYFHDLTYNEHYGTTSTSTTTTSTTTSATTNSTTSSKNKDTSSSHHHNGAEIVHKSGYTFKGQLQDGFYHGIGYEKWSSKPIIINVSSITTTNNDNQEDNDDENMNDTTTTIQYEYTYSGEFKYGIKNGLGEYTRIKKIITNNNNNNNNDNDGDDKQKNKKKKNLNTKPTTESSSSMITSSVKQKIMEETKALLEKQGLLPSSTALSTNEDNDDDNEEVHVGDIDCSSHDDTTSSSNDNSKIGEEDAIISTNQENEEANNNNDDVIDSSMIDNYHYYKYIGNFYCNIRQGDDCIEYVIKEHHHNNSSNNKKQQSKPRRTKEIYKGQFVNNMRHGYGSLRIIETGIIYEGLWCNNKPISGNGWKIIYPNKINTYYMGCVSVEPIVNDKNDNNNNSNITVNTTTYHDYEIKANGYGIYNDEEEHIVNNIVTERGVTKKTSIMRVTNNIYQGHFKDNSRHGHGVVLTKTYSKDHKNNIINSKINEFVGEWDNNRLVKIQCPNETLKELGHILFNTNSSPKNQIMSNYMKRNNELLLRKAIVISITSSLKLIGNDKEFTKYKSIFEAEESAEKSSSSSKNLMKRSSLEFLKSKITNTTNGNNNDNIDVSIHSTGSTNSNRRASLDNSDLSDSTRRGKRTIVDNDESSINSKDKNKKEKDKDNDEDQQDDSNKALLRTYPNDDTYVGHLDEKSSRVGFGCYYSKYTGCTYTGEFVSNTRHGFGILLHPQLNGKYVGEFVNDHKHGIGTLLLNNTTSTTSTNSGGASSSSNSIASNGSNNNNASTNIGSCYHGNFVHGTFDGYGTYKCNREGISYVGEFRGGVRHGVGLETYADGRVYHGEYKNGKRDGYGTLLEKSPLRSKIIYTGCWRDGLYHGKGTSIQRHLFDEPDNAAGTTSVSKQQQRQKKIGLSRRSNSNSSISSDEQEEYNNFIEQEDDYCKTKTGFTTKFDGTFVNGKRHAYGTLTSDANNITWKGMWDNGQPMSGKWRIEYKDGSIYSGMATVGGFELKDNNRTSTQTKLTSYNNECNVMAFPDGMGTIKYANGDVYIGQFENGIRSGEGSIMFSTGDKWDGTWSDDQLNEDMPNTLTTSSGTTHEFNSKSRGGSSSNKGSSSSAISSSASLFSRMGLTSSSSTTTASGGTVSSKKKLPTDSTKSSWSWFY